MQKKLFDNLDFAAEAQYVNLKNQKNQLFNYVSGSISGLEVGRPTSISVEGHFQKVFFVGFEPETSSFLC